MWKPRPDEKPVLSNSPSQPALAPAIGKETRTMEPVKTVEPSRANVAAHIGKSVLVKGELSGSEDLYLDGEVEGSIQLQDHCLVVGPNGRVRANISAREVVLHGTMEGNILRAERVELKRSSVLSGDVATNRIVIEDGAQFKGKIDPQPIRKPEPVRTFVAPAAPASVEAPSSSAQPLLETALLEHA